MQEGHLQAIEQSAGTTNRVPTSALGSPDWATPDIQFEQPTVPEPKPESGEIIRIYFEVPKSAIKIGRAAS